MSASLDGDIEELKSKLASAAIIVEGRFRSFTVRDYQVSSGKAVRRAAIKQQNQLMLRRQREFRLAADVVTDA